MSTYYNAESSIYAHFNQDTIYKILRKCEDKGNIFLGKNYHRVNLQEAINFVMAGVDDPKYHVVHIKQNQNENTLESLMLSSNKDILNISLSIGYREYFLNGFYMKECVKPAYYLLDLISDFQLQNFFVTHDGDGLFENSIEQNMFYVLTHSTYPKEKNLCARDAFYIIRQLRNIDCIFITESGKEVNQDSLIEKIATMLLSSKNSASEEDCLIIKTANGSLIKATFFNYAFQFLPLHPWTMKQREERTSIDVAYYTRILLAMAEPFGIIELATHCNNAFYE